MNISVTFSDNTASPESLRVDKQLGQGKFSVFQVYSASRKTNYALKVFPKSRLGTALYEKEQRFSTFSHPHLIRQIPITTNHDNLHAHLTELAKFGDFFDVVNESMLNNNEVLIRTYFRQLVEGVEHMHSQGVAHLDLKLENLMLGTDFQLKIIDFDQAQLLSDEVIESRGTKNYRAPEVSSGQSKDFTQGDIYSMGIILYALLMGEFPFSEDDENTTENNAFIEFNTNNQAFWNERANDSIFLSQDFMDLINGMLTSNTEKRFKIQEIKASKWYNGAVLDNKELKSEMRASWNAVMRKREEKSENHY